jgi:hypothetical protein
MDGDSETIEIGTVSRGDDAGESVELPVVDVLTGRSFLTGTSGSGKSNSASVICEKLLDRGYGMLIVDVDGEYYGLKEAYEILHVGADEACDLRVDVEHAEKIAELALERRVPIVLDVSSFIDESRARALLTAVTKRLFAKAKKKKQPFVLLVEEIHEYIPEDGSLDEFGRMLSTVGKRGRKHGLGILGISQRPADVKKEFLTQCDWLVWHRLTWNDDTQVLGRILGSDYADHVEEMADGECFLQGAESVRVVQFERKRTFDAGATPGLGDVEQPELKPVSDDLLGELEAITAAGDRRADRIAELERELERREEHITDLERQLADARDLGRMADRFSRDQVTGRPQSAVADDADGTAGAMEPADSAIATDDDAAPSVAAAAAWDDSLLGRFDTTAAAADQGDRQDGHADTFHDGPADPVAPVADTAPEPPDANAPGDGVAPSASGDRAEPAAGPDLVEDLRSAIDSLSVVERQMLRHYRDDGPATPMAAHAAAGGSGDRTEAYAANRALRRVGVVEHAARGTHRYALPTLVEARGGDPFETDGLADGERDRLVQRVEASFVPEVRPPSAEPDPTGVEAVEFGDGVGAWPDV